MNRSKKRVLYITYDGLTDSLGQSQIIPYLKGLSDEFSIHILSCEKQARLDAEGETIHKLLKSANIEWSYIIYTKKPPVFSTLKDIRKMRKLALKLHREESFQMVHCRTVLAWLIAKKIKSPKPAILFDMRGFWADERVDGKLWNLKNPLFKTIYGFFKALQSEAYHKADALVSLTEKAKAEIVEQESIAENKISVVPCNADQSHFLAKKNYLESAKRLRTELKINEDQLVMGYVGSLGTRYLLEEMLDCFVAIRKRYSDALFLIITHSPTEALEEMIIEKKLTSAIRLGSSSYQQIPEYISLIDIALYFIYPGNSGAAVSPTKQAEFLSMGIPIITNSGIGDSKLILDGEGVGISLDRLDEEEFNTLAGQIEKLKAIPSSEIIKIAQQYFSLENGVATYREIYRQL